MTSRTHIKHVGYFYTFHLTLLREHAVRNVAAGSHYSGAFLDIFPHAIFQWKALLWTSINGLKRPDLLRWMSSKQNWIISMFVNRPCSVYSAWWAVMGDLLSQGLDKANRSTWEHFWFCSLSKINHPDWNQNDQSEVYSRIFRTFIRKHVVVFLV